MSLPINQAAALDQVVRPKRTYRELLLDPGNLAGIVRNNNPQVLADCFRELLDRCVSAESGLRSALLLHDGHDEHCKKCRTDWREAAAAHFKLHETSLA